MGLGSKKGPPVPPRTCRPSTLSLIGNNNNVQVLTGTGSEPRCQCCPYGFHIDLDFVRFCESIATGSELKQKREERRARRLQCNSMEVLLGLAPTPSYPSFPTLPAIIDTQSEGGCAIGHELDRVVDDFEVTLSMSSRNSQSSQVSAGDLPPPPNYAYWHQGREYETAYQEAKNEALQAVRGQMAASLEKLRQLEQQVKMIPVLQVKVSVLQEEKRKLAAQLTDMKNKWTSRNVEVPKRDVGVGTLTSKLKDEIVQTEKWIQNVSNKLIQTLWLPKTESAIQTDPLRLEHVDVVRSNVHTQTINAEPPGYVPVPTNDAQSQTFAQVTCNVNVQTMAISAERKYVQTDPVIPERKQHTHSQTEQPICERKHNIYVQTDNSLMASALVGEKRFSGVPARKSIAVGDGAINDVLCDNCRSKRTRHVACSTDSVRPTSGVNVATQCFSPCMECKERSRLSLLKETVDRESQTVAEVSGVESVRNSRIVEPVEEPPSPPCSEAETDDSGASEEDCGVDESISGSSEDDFDEEDEAEEEEPLQILEPLKPRVRVEPSVEMKAALKVLNDSVHRPQSRTHSKQLVNAIEIVRREWVQISSTKDANAHVVEDYMDYVESLSMELLERVANMADNNGNTALHYAVSHSQWDIVSLLLDSKVCYPQLRNKAGYSPPMLAALAQPTNGTEIQVLQRLFSLADVNSKATQHGQTALMLAVSHGRVEVVRLLLQCGADVNVQDSDGSTALMCAAEHGHVQIVRLLLAQPDIDLHLRDNDGSTALSIAMEAGHKDIGLLIYAHMNFHRSNSSSAASSPTVHTSPVSGPSAKKIYHSAS